MIFASVITQLKLPKPKHLTEEIYLYHKRCGWWGKKILDQVARRADSSNWNYLGMSQFSNGKKTFGFVCKFTLNGFLLTLSEIYHEQVHNSQFVISLVRIV